MEASHKKDVQKAFMKAQRRINMSEGVGLLAASRSSSSRSPALPRNDRYTDEKVMPIKTWLVPFFFNIRHSGGFSWEICLLAEWDCRLHMNGEVVRNAGASPGVIKS